MKKIAYIFIMLFVAFATVQCSKKESLSRVNGNANGYMELRGDKVYISLPVGRSEQTRTVINGEDFTTQWKAGDKLYVVAPTGGCLGYLVAGADGASATFTGSIAAWTGTQDLQFYYLGSGELATAATSFAYSVASQNGVLDDLAANLQLTHGEIKGLVPSSRILGSITMTNLIAVAKFDLIGKSGFASGTNVTCATVASATLNLADGTFSGLTNGTITMSSPSAAYYAAFIPGSQNFTFSQSGCIDVVFNSSAALVGNDFITNNALAAIEVTNGGLGGYVEDGWGYGPGIEIDGVVWAPVNCGSGYNSANPNGLLYQFGRSVGSPYSSAKTGFQTAKAAEYTDGYNKMPDDAYMYYTSGGDWYTNVSGAGFNVWPSVAPEGTTGIADPCPTGWRVPTNAELTSLIAHKSAFKNGYTFSGSVSASSTTKKIFLQAAGCRYYNTGEAANDNTHGYYWASTTTGDYADCLLFYDGYAKVETTKVHRSGSASVRCVQEARTDTHVAFWESTSSGMTSDVKVLAASAESFTVQFTPTNGQYEKINIPIHNLTVDQFYTLTFGENITMPTSNQWNSSAGVYATSVRNSRVTGTDISKVLTKATSDKQYFTWAHSRGDYSAYTPVPSASITFQATATTMYWVWDVSKTKNGQVFNITISLVGDGIKPLDTSASPKVELWNSVLTGYIFNSGSGDDGDQGKETNRVYADNSRLDLVTYAMKGSDEFVNIPITGLTSGTKYKLSFDYQRSEGTLYTSSEYDFCFGVKSSKVTSGSPKSGTTGYTEKITATSFSRTLQFTATATTMYWVWCQNAMPNNTKFEQTASNVKLEVDTD